MSLDQFRPVVEASFEFSGGALCLDYVNTLSDRPRCSNERLTSPGDLVRWGRAAGLLRESDERCLERRMARHPREAEREFRAALDLREALFEIFAARAAGRASPAASLSSLNAILERAHPFLVVVRDACGFRWSWRGGRERLERLVWPVARSAAELLTSEALADVRECGSESCSWLFLDRSRNRRRRWCDMKTCGNRAKARRHYRRHKSRT